MTLAHVYSHYNSNNAVDERRKALAHQTWIETYKQSDHITGWIPLPVMDETLRRIFVDGKRRLPYIKDLVNEALKVNADYIVLTNADTCFAPCLHDILAEWCLGLSPTKPVCCNRKDFDRIDAPLTDKQIRDCPSLYPGIDLFAFQPDWWLSIRDDFPDMILGAEAWDACFWHAIRARNGYSVPNLIYHERHNAEWEQSHQRYKLHSQIYNLWLANEWLKGKGVDPTSMGIKDVCAPWDMPLPTTAETPNGGWHLSYKGIFITHPYCFETVLKNAKVALKIAGIEIPNDLKDLIVRQSCSFICPTQLAAGQNYPS